jgi:hypothetical protein
MAKRNMVWVKRPDPPKFTKDEKAKILTDVKAAMQELPKVSEIVSRFDMKANRIYLYHLVEQFLPEGIEVEFIKPLIDGKYIEYPYARITLNDKRAEKCTADWQRPNDEWISLYAGTLAECLKEIENDNAYFGNF